MHIHPKDIRKRRRKAVRFSLRALPPEKSLVGLLIELHCAGERIRREGTAALVSFTAELPRRLLPGRCQDSRSLVAGEGTPY
jgi:hypothetical protein